MRPYFTIFLFALVGCPQPAELCSDGIDNDGDGLIDAADSDCSNSIQTEDCLNGVDDDGDGAVDCLDADCVLAASCLSEDCTDGSDNDLDELADCDDPDCSEDPNCVGALVWALSGDAIVNDTRTSYSGVMHMTDTVLDADAGRYEIDQVLCDATYNHLSSGQSLPAPCDDCEWALPVGPATYTSHVGPECDSWYDFVDVANPNYYGTWTFPEAIGYTATYQGDGISFPAVMFFLNDGDQYNGWYGWAFGDNITWDETTGELSWWLPIGYFSYQ